MTTHVSRSRLAYPEGTPPPDEVPEEDAFQVELFNWLSGCAPLHPSLLPYTNDGRDAADDDVDPNWTTSWKRVIEP
jgi:hypothetical protein